SQSKLIVVPLRIEDVSPNDAFAYEFATRQWIDFFADWEFAIQQLAQRIAAATHEANAGAVTEDPAPETDISERAPKAAGEPPAEPEPPKPSAKPAPPASAKAKPKVLPPAEIGEQSAARSRAPLYLALSAAAALALAAGLILPGALRHKAGPAGPRIMAAVHPAAPAGVQQVSIEVAPDPTLAPLPSAAANADAVPAEAAPAADKPAPRKRKSAHPARTADNYVPY
ncbi:MAG TPA: hypothetical protein VLI41_10400, partial [Phenylobacterium sp.]|nr:hypothetical protein [Phenylobacterium sp.]